MPQENQKPLSEIEATQIKDAVAGNPPIAQSNPSEQNNYSSVPPSNLPNQSAPPPIPQLSAQPQQTQPMTEEIPSNSQGMTPSLMSSPELSPPQGYNQGYEQDAGFDSYSSDPYQSLDSSGSDYQPYSSISPETITEIAESIVLEKISPIKRKIEQAVDSKTTFESKLSGLDDRLKRIEKIIDKLQISILERVGKYVNDVSDLKKELIETQKSFNFVNKVQHKTNTKK